MIFADHLTLDAPRRTGAGYLAVRARAAKTGVYQYTGREVDPDNAHGLRDQAIVNVLRDEATVFDESAVRTFIGKPITNDHPTVAVTSKNWKDHARGTVMGALRDGDHLAFDLLLMDESAIADVGAGKVEISNGYSASLDFGDFTAADGTKCPVRQARISDGNHVAIVDRARGGNTCRIADAAHCDAAPRSFLDSLMTQEKPVKTMLIDGLTVDVSNAETAVATINTLIAARDAALGKVTAHDATIATKDRELAGKDTEIADLKRKIGDEATLDARAEAKADLVTKGKSLLGDKMPNVTGKSLADTRRAIVLAVTNDAALVDKSDDYIEARFDGLRDAKSASTVVPIGAPVSLGDARTKRDAAVAAAADRNANAWRAPVAAEMGS